MSVAETHACDTRHIFGVCGMRPFPLLLSKGDVPPKNSQFCSFLSLVVSSRSPHTLVFFQVAVVDYFLFE